MPDTAPILVIGGSTRPNRRSPEIAAWVAAITRDVTGLPVQTVDLRTLALEDEPGMAALGAYTHEATRRWSVQVSGARAVVFVTPQYNWGYPAPLKNAIDHLYAEWWGKPGLIVTYGGHGGGKCAAQLREVLTGLHLNLTEAMPALRLPRPLIEADDGVVDPDRHFAEQHGEVEEALRQLATLSAARPA